MARATRLRTFERTALLRLELLNFFILFAFCEVTVTSVERIYLFMMYLTKKHRQKQLSFDGAKVRHFRGLGNRADMATFIP